MTIARLPAPDVVHVHLGEDLAVVPLALLGARRGAPVVMTLHTSLTFTFNDPGARGALLRSLGGRLERAGARRAAAVIVLTERLRSALVGVGVAPERIHVVPPGIVPELFEGPFADPLAIDRPRVVFVGRIAPQKNVEALVRALPALRADARLVVVGDGPGRRRLERLARDLGVSDRVTITGFVPHERVPAYLAHADVLVLPSHHEELGTVLLEAMCAAVPVVATATGGVPFVVADGRDGLLVPPGNDAALVTAVNRLLDDPELASRLGRSGRETAARYAWAMLAERVLAVYGSVLGADAQEGS